MTSAPTYDLFISYAQADQAWAQGYLMQALEDAGIRCLSEESFALGVPRLVEFERAVLSSQRTLLVLSPAYLADGFTRFADLLAQSYGVASKTWPVIPLVLGGATELPERLRMLIPLDASDHAGWPLVIDRLCTELRRPPPAPSIPPPCPYPGLAPYSPRDAETFFGRDEEILDLIGRLKADQQRLFIVGSSGSGKSSLIAAGLLPALWAGRHFPREYWVVRGLRPSDPVMRAFTEAVPEDKQRPGDVIARQLKRHAKAQKMLLVIDQFEELFTQVEKPLQRRYIQALQALYEDKRCVLLIAMRADFYPDLMNSDLWPLGPGERLELAPPRGAALRRAIERPAQARGVYLDPRLIERLISDDADEPGAMPLVQEALVMLWGQMQHRLIPLAAYERLGSGGRSGLAVAMATAADAALAKLPITEQAIARRILLRLVQFGEGRADTRRQQPRAVLRAGEPNLPAFEATLDYLTRHRLLTITAEPIIGRASLVAGSGAVPRAPKELVDIAHEALIAGWPTLRVWLDERREDEQIRRRLESQASEWLRLHGQGGLLDVIELTEAEHWLAKPEATALGPSRSLRALVETSRAMIKSAEERRAAAQRHELDRARALADERAQRLAAQRRELDQAHDLAAEREQHLTDQTRFTTRLRWLVVGLTIAVMVTLALAAYARSQARVALARQLAAQSIAMLDDQIDVSLLLGLAAFTTADIEAARYSLIAVQEHSPYLEIFLRGHHSEITSVAFSPDGHLIATSDCGMTNAHGRCQQGDVRLWNTASHRLNGMPLGGHGSGVDSVAFSPNGHLLATAGCGAFDADDNCSWGEIRLWNVDTRQQIGPPLTGDSGGITSIAFSPNGASLASAGRNGTITLWEMPSGRQSGAPLTGHNGIISAIAFSPDGTRLVSGGWDKTVRLWDVVAHAAVHLSSELHPDHVRSVAFSPDGVTLASGDLAGQIWLWKADTLTRYGAPLVDTAGQVWSLAFSPDGQLLASGGRAKRIRLWQVATGQPVGADLAGHQDSVTSLAFSSDGKYLVSGSQDTTVILWNIGAQPPLLGYAGPVRSVVFGLDDRFLIAGGCGQIDTKHRCVQGEIRIWDTTTYKLVRTPIRAHTDAMRTIALSKDGRLLATGSADGTIILWNTTTWLAIGQPLRAYSGRVESVVFSPNGKLLASAGCGKYHAGNCSQGTIQLWDVERQALSGQPIIAHHDSVTSMTFSSDGNTLVSGSLDRTILLWNVSTRQQIGEPLLGHANRVYSVAFNASSTILASAGADQDVILWNMTTHKPLGKPLTGHTDSIYSVAFSPDGTTLASASADGSVLLWDVATRQRIGTPMHGHPTSIFNLAFSHDGRHLATAGENQTVIPWNVDFLKQYDATKWTNLVCSTVARDLTGDELTQYGNGTIIDGTGCKAVREDQ